MLVQINLKSNIQLCQNVYNLQLLKLEKKGMLVPFFTNEATEMPFSIVYCIFKSKFLQENIKVISNVINIRLPTAIKLLYS